LGGLGRFQTNVQRLRGSRSGRVLVLVVMVLCYAAGLLWPFKLSMPAHLSNGAQWTATGGLSFAEPGLVLGEAPGWQRAIRESGSLKLGLRVRTFDPHQAGPARILTLSRDTWSQNLLVGQEGSDLIVRLAVTCGRFVHRRCIRSLRARDVFAGEDWMDLTLEVGSHQATVTVDGREPRSWPLPQEPFGAWDDDYRLAFGNDVTGYRPWRGAIMRAKLWWPEARELLVPATLSMPRSFWVLKREPKWVPFRDVPWLDIPVNLVLFMPWVLTLFWLWGGAGRSCAVLGIGVTIAVSASFETVQLFFSRNPSVTDVLLNCSGAALAVLAWPRLRAGWPRS
jgi:hypothetical protein